jgi:hypothetical protein
MITARLMRVRAPRYERMPMTESDTSLSMTTLASQMIAFSTRDRVTFAAH